ncbi:ankyrin repeat-containing domain protein [Sphaerosporella brunnea]|uniref:Ankyrin repeat-containing domain protein n=1 Tax=Sphaerosporella brunnea TaxID=1250544 RepID=A0A5J5EEW5_9PEZI|nr:ankyrin repeat-containing domain protein [Sphaerosporella brunnea]
MATTSPLEKVPFELLLLIVENLSQSALNNFALTNRNFHAKLNPLLYKRAVQDEGHEEKQSALDWALSHRSEPTLDLLLESGLDIEAPIIGQSWIAKRWYIWSLDPPTPLLAAAAQGTEWAVRILIAKGANVNATKEAGETPLHAAARWGFESLIRPLVEAGANLEAPTESYGWRPLWVAAHCPTWNNGRRKTDTIGAIRELVALGADIEGRDLINGLSPLDEAVESGYVRAVKVLLELGADVSAAGKDNIQAIHRAAYGGHLPIVQMLVNHGADLKAKVFDGQTPLSIYRRTFGTYPSLDQAVNADSQFSRLAFHEIVQLLKPPGSEEEDSWGS